MQIYTCSVPTPFFWHPVNAYLVVLPNGKALMVDTGINTPELWKALESTMGKARVEWRNIRFILLTHGHIDHFGMTAQIVERSGATVLIDDRDMAKITGVQITTESRQTISTLLTRHGLTEKEAETYCQVISEDVKYAPPVPERAISSFTTSSFEELEEFGLKILYTPGHSLGSCCFYNPTEKILFTGDSIVSAITPIPAFEFRAGERQAYESIIQMRESFRNLCRLSIVKMYPGHGKTIFSSEKFIEGQLNKISTRSERFLHVLDTTPTSAEELTVRLFPNLKVRQKVLALTEVLGHLGWLELRGCVRRLELSGVVQWVKVLDSTVHQLLRHVDEY